jgi:hypothetical protein
MFIFGRFGVPYVELLQHLDSDCGRQIAIQFVITNKTEQKIHKENTQRQSIC